jgi:N6-adenosine-specific RNA methylase IME4
MADWPFGDLQRNHYGAILADPPWRFATWNKQTAVQKRGSKTTYFASVAHYSTMTTEEIARLPVSSLAEPDCVLFMWIVWPMLKDALALVEAWGFEYKTCAFCWMKADASQVDLFADAITPRMLMGYWTRANSEVCLLAVRGKPKRLNADVRQGIVEPAREHSRKPDGIHERIERLVAGPYVELFARQTRPGWDSWGNEVNKFDRGDAETGDAGHTILGSACAGVGDRAGDASNRAGIGESDPRQAPETGERSPLPAPQESAAASISVGKGQAARSVRAA